MIKQRRFLAILWAYILCSFALFQNFTQNVSPNTLHNESCKRALQMNESRILGVNTVQSNLLAAWPRSAPDLGGSFSGLSKALIDANSQIYSLCVSDSAVRESHILALAELNRLSDPATNRPWKNYLAAIENTLQQLTGAK